MKLTLNLVPETCWFSNLRSELDKADWDRLRRVQYRRARYRCEVCGGRGPDHPVECHEVWDYEDGTQKLTGLVALCPSCHEVKHMGLAVHRGRAEEALVHFARVNDLGPDDTLEHVEGEFAVHERRSRQTWDLDLGWLVNHGIYASTINDIERRRRTANGASQATPETSRAPWGP